MDIQILYNLLMIRELMGVKPEFKLTSVFFRTNVFQHAAFLFLCLISCCRVKKLKERSKERWAKGREERKKGRKEGRKEKRKTLSLFKSLFQASECWGSQALTQTEVRKGPWHLPIKQVRTISNLWSHMPDSFQNLKFSLSL